MSHYGGLALPSSRRLETTMSDVTGYLDQVQARADAAGHDLTGLVRLFEDYLGGD